MKRLMLPVGVDNFAELANYKNSDEEKYTFIDKTLFIKDLVKSGDKISLITRPRRFGKTLNMSMLQHFFAPEVNGESTKGLFEGLQVSKYPDIMKYQGKYPVVFVTFKEIRGKNFDEAFEVLKQIISHLFDSHKYLLKNNKLDNNEKFLFNNFISKIATASDYKSSLLFLTNLLYKHSSQKVIILLDEYDTPLHDAYVNGYYEEMRSFLATMFNMAFKGNSYLFKAVITGILKIAKSSLFSELNNVEDYTVLYSKLYAEYFGFTQKEVDYLLKEANLEECHPKLKQYYNGYLINDITLYNPYSIICFVKNALLTKKDNLEEAIRPYWINSGGHGVLKPMISYNIVELEPKLRDLINNKPIITQVNENVIISNRLKRETISFWSILLISGYLKILRKRKDDFGDTLYELNFPNEEVRQSMKNFFLKTVSENYCQYILAIKELTSGNVEEFINFLKEYIREKPSYYDEDGRFKKQFYHGLILGMTSLLSKLYIIRSNRESGKGRYDIALEPKDKHRKGVIIELKSPEKEFDLKKEAKLALAQI